MAERTFTAAHDALRPTRLADFSGQPDISEQLRIILGAADVDDRLPPHMLFSGPPGLGKTTLAQIVANELDQPGRRVRLVATSAPVLAKPADIAGLLIGLDEPSVVFIDEIHRLDRVVEEMLYSAMEDGVLDIKLDDGPDARVLRTAVEPFTLVGATTQQGLVSAPLRDRFGYHAKLRLYGDDALSQIVLRSADKTDVAVTDASALAIAVRSRGTPRIANQLLARVRDWVKVEATSAPNVNVGHVDAAMATFGIDAIGLNELGQQLLHTLCVQFAGGPVGLSTLAAAVDEQPVTVEIAYEPFLLRRGMLQRTPRGRVATAAAYTHLGIDPPASAPRGGDTAQLQFEDDHPRSTVF